MSAFQANDESSILSARTTDRLLKTPEISGVFYSIENAHRSVAWWLPKFEPLLA